MAWQRAGGGSGVYPAPSKRRKAGEGVGGGPGEAKAVERPLKRVDGPVAKVERSLVNGKVELPKTPAIDRIVKPERAPSGPGGERPQFDHPSTLDKRIDQIVRPLRVERPPVIDRPPVPDKPIDRIVKPERPRIKL